MSNIMLNSQGRVFIEESPCDVFEYSDDCGTQVSGVSESFGDITNIYCSSSSSTDGYDIIAQIAGSQSSPTTTITSYLPADGYSQLLRLGRKKCTFNMAIKYGACSNPTDFNDFDYAIMFEGVRITSSSSTDLTSRSPDTRAAIDITFNVTIKKIYEMVKPSYLETATDTTVVNGGMQAIYAYNNTDCSGGNCADDCDLFALQKRDTTYRMYRRIDGIWLNSGITSGITQAGANTAWVYTDGITVYAAFSGQSPTKAYIYSASYDDLETTSPLWTQVASLDGITRPRTYAYGGNLYFGISNGTSSYLAVLDTSSGSITEIGNGTINSTIWSVFGYGSTVYVGTGDGELFVYSNGSLAKTSTDFGTGVTIDGVAIHDADTFKILANKRDKHCTTDGGASWTSGGSLSVNQMSIAPNVDNPWHSITLFPEIGMYDSFDGGLSNVLNTTITDSTIFPSGVTFCGDKIYIAMTNSNYSIGGIYENKR